MKDKAKPVLTAITLALACGVGITGTLLWLENRAEPQPVPAAPMTATATPVPDIANIPGLKMPQGAVPQGAVPQDALPGGGQRQDSLHVPPATLTQGKSPPEAALTLGNWFYDHEQWNLAINHYAEAIRGGMDSSDIRTDLGNALRFSGHPQEALKQYQAVQKQDPKHEQSLFNQGALYAVSLKNPRKGIEAWKAYLKRFPSGGSAKQARELIAKFAKAR